MVRLDVDLAEYQRTLSFLLQLRLIQATYCWNNPDV
jgi:hypothetical protein